MTQQAQAETLKLAEIIERRHTLVSWKTCDEAAAELRRLHARVQELEEERKPLTDEQAKEHADAIKDPLTRTLYLAWAKAEPRHGVTHFPVSYFATFREMAEAARAHGIGVEAK